MTRDKLRQYDDLLQELREARDRFGHLQREAERDEATRGMSLFGDIYGVERERARLSELTARVSREREAILQYIDGIPDSIERRAMRLRYLDGMSWAAVAMRLRYAGESGARSLCERCMTRQGEN